MGKVIMSGMVPKLKNPAGALMASNLAVGSSVYLKENGVPVEYIVVNQGIPSNSSIYHSSCNGTWLLRKELYLESMAFNDGTSNYDQSDMDRFLVVTFFALFDTTTQDAILSARIPVYYNSYESVDLCEVENVSAKIFLLSAPELGFEETCYFTDSDGMRRSYTYYGDGACLEYFSGVADEYVNGAVADKFIADFNGDAAPWWLRTLESDTEVWAIAYDGDLDSSTVDSDYPGVRPALILNSNAVFDEETLVFKGVA